jgi:tryptophanyl-tRNA synthetase
MKLSALLAPKMSKSSQVQINLLSNPTQKKFSVVYISTDPTQGV